MSNKYRHWFGHSQKHCRWCGSAYTAYKPIGQDGFCSSKCKQAHYRAYKNYVTAISQLKARTAHPSVTRKKRK